MMFIRTLTKAIAVVSMGCASTASTPPAPDAALEADASTAPPPDAGPPLPPQTTRLRIVNRCDEAITVAPLGVELAPGGYHDVAIPDEGLASQRYWAQLDPGLPPIDSKFEATFAPIGSSDSRSRFNTPRLIPRAPTIGSPSTRTNTWRESMP